MLAVGCELKSTFDAGLGDPEVDHPVNFPVGGMDPFETAPKQTSKQPVLQPDFLTFPHFLDVFQDKAMAGLPSLVTQLGTTVIGTVKMEPGLGPVVLVPTRTLMLTVTAAKGVAGHSFNSTVWLVAGSTMFPINPRGALIPLVPGRRKAFLSQSLAVKEKTTGCPSGPAIPPQAIVLPSTTGLKGSVLLGTRASNLRPVGMGVNFSRVSRKITERLRVKVELIRNLNNPSKMRETTRTTFFRAPEMEKKVIRHTDALFLSRIKHKSAFDSTYASFSGEVTVALGGNVSG